MSSFFGTPTRHGTLNYCTMDWIWKEELEHFVNWLAELLTVKPFRKGQRSKAKTCILFDRSRFKKRPSIQQFYLKRISDPVCGKMVGGVCFRSLLFPFDSDQWQIQDTCALCGLIPLADYIPGRTSMAWHLFAECLALLEASKLQKLLFVSGFPNNILFWTIG